jgi:hypothetical protein
MTDATLFLLVAAKAVVDAYCRWAPDEVPEDFDNAIATLGDIARHIPQETTR